MYSVICRVREDRSQIGDVDSDGFYHRWRCFTGEKIRITSHFILFSICIEEFPYSSSFPKVSNTL